jgi:hypothetical protein
LHRRCRAAKVAPTKERPEARSRIREAWAMAKARKRRSKRMVAARKAEAPARRSSRNADGLACRDTLGDQCTRTRGK